MFGIWSRRKVEVIDHWYVLKPDFRASVSEFYQAVEQELQKRRVPGIETSRVLFPEGSIISARREYLRMRRERLVFDICSAPFGDSWFFSCRFAEIPLKLRVWEILLLLWIAAIIWSFYAAVFGFVWGTGIFWLSLIGVLYLLNSVVTMGLYGIDALLLKIPVLGAFYEVCLRRNTYYREDTRLMYCDLVDQIVKEKVQEFTGAKELTHVEFKKNPIPPKMGFFDVMREMFKGLWGGSTRS